MNFAKAYIKATKQDVPVVEDEGSPADAKNAAQHLEWYKLPQTQDFINFLQKERDGQLEMAVSLALQGAGEKQKDKCLVKAATLNLVIDYARTNQRSTDTNE